MRILRRSPLPQAERMVRSAFRALAAARQAPAFHPRGLVLTGELETISTSLVPLPAGKHPVITRLSKGAGTPGPFPDALGLAIRVPETNASADSWDITLTTCGPGALGRLLPWPARSWTSSRYSSLAPYQLDRGLVWLSAVASPHQPKVEASLPALSRQLEITPLRFTLYAAKGFQGWKPVAKLRLRRAEFEHSQPSFDPIAHCPPSIWLYPSWLSRLRGAAYSGSRSGRHSIND